MASNNEMSSLLQFAADGHRVHKHIVGRLKRIEKSLNALCRETAVGISTIWRWKKGGKPTVRTLAIIDHQITEWERKYRRAHKASTRK